MVEVIPFRGVRYDKERIESMNLVVTPPYDVISDDERDVYYSNSEYSVIKLSLGRGEKGDSDENNKYTRAKKFLDEWTKEGILKRDGENSLYIYEQEYSLPTGERKIMRGFICLVGLEDLESGHIYPHERTLPKPAEDRFRLIKAVRANISPIISVYSDRHNRINSILKTEAKREPVLRFADEEGITHGLWVVQDDKIIEAVVSGMKELDLFIADGHHRYETALKYSKEGDGSNKHVMMLLVDMNEGGISILPAHRLLRNVRKMDEEELESRLLEYFDLEVFRFDGDELSQRRKMFEHMWGKSEGGAFGMYVGGKKYYLLTLKDDAIIDGIDGSKPRAWKELDAVILHSLIIEGIFGVKDDGSVKYEESIKFIKSRETAIQAVYEKEYDVALFLNPTKMSQVENVAKTRTRMPQKSTYFYPKPLTGLVMNVMD
ncbi:MAG: DUF1015 domain-containing protein [Candidatus Altiarchaeales archaeon]|nr:DUF1015 domain-containing protein [Candidatus Altiarchaeota archaeon]MBU4436834.1 DUF1015 domain-containing protein [Candidatus Altiarchaeota archaeon]MCG2782977.1 DUF1015 domain-containing protein [Candidatus Altiarchaeales archaeon]